MIMVDGKEGIRLLRHNYHFFLYSMLVVQKGFKIVKKVLRITVALENIQ